ncbi:MAG: radical SAM protein [Gammaproteobacteria bacterium]|nr:MAG: radical SAM protein [Gammaproteobacteria bacterium]
MHLLYVPTIACNLACKYCYLEDQTCNDFTQDPVQTLEHALEKFHDAGVLPFNLSLHGGEVTTLKQDALQKLFNIIQRHYVDNLDALVAEGFKKQSPHIKTNLYNFDKLYDLLAKQGVSISGSVDLPLSLHDKYRRTKGDESTLNKTLDNLKLLAKYPHSKKLSSTIYLEHFNNIEQLIQDIWFIHSDIGFDMNNFNFMFGFESDNDSLPLGIQQLTDTQQVEFYQRLKTEFIGTDLEYGLKRNWFDEFRPTYCTNSVNCGERFFLLQGDGEIYSCVRGQGRDDFYYGNILNDSVEDIFANGKRKISTQHQELGLHQDCRECEYIHYCHTGCPYVKNLNQDSKSYTCALQKQIYLDNPITYPPAKDEKQQKYYLHDYLIKVHPMEAQNSELVSNAGGSGEVILPNDLYQNQNSIRHIIEQDAVLQDLYSNEAIIFELDDMQIRLHSQILKRQRDIYSIFSGQSAKLHIKKSIFDANCNEPVRNTMYLQMLRDTNVVYGDEKRVKQEHTFTHQIYYNHLAPSEFGDEYVSFELCELFKLHEYLFVNGVLNNLFVTTSYLRDYHYKKQKDNAFYHIQALNLPFQNIEFYWER